MNVTIEKIEIISFGKLKNISVTPSEGINILSAPNESGKSTLAAFIKFAFYGFAGGRLQSLTDNEKKLYTPWDSELSEGSVDIDADGKKYSIHRRCPPSGKETVTVTNRLTGKAELVGLVPGEEFFGVEEDVFARTLFFRQLTLPQEKDDVLAEKLRNIAMSGNEEISEKNAKKRLMSAKNDLKGNVGRGLIPSKTRERDAVAEAVVASRSARSELERISADIAKRSSTVAECEKKLAAVKAERDNSERYEAAQTLKKLDRYAQEAEKARAEYAKASAALKKLDDSGAVKALLVKNIDYTAECHELEAIEEALVERRAERAGLVSPDFDYESSLEAGKTVRSSERIGKIMFILAAVALIGGLIFYFASGSGAGVVIAALSVAFAAVGGVVLSRGASAAREVGFDSVSELKDMLEDYPELSKRIYELDGRISSLELKYSDCLTRCTELKHELDIGISEFADDIDGDYTEQLNRINELSADIGLKLSVWRAKRDSLETASEGIDRASLERAAEGATEPKRERAAIERDIQYLSKQISVNEEQNQQDKIDIAALESKSGDPAVLVGKLNSLSAEIDELTLKYEAYLTAVEYMEAASDDMKSLVAPMIGKRADLYFSAATGGKYTSFEIDTRLSMSYGDDFRRSVDYLSAGTRDSAYISLRLALADRLFGGCSVPIMFDDAFSRIDDNRLRMMSAALGEAAKNHQIFILTHGHRERDALTDVGVEATDIYLKTV